MQVKIILLSDTAVIPKRQTEGSVGYDLFADIDGECIIPPNGTRLIKTGFAVELPDNVAAFVYPRSGLSSKYGVTLANCVGVIDSDYRGEITVPLKNTGDSDFTVTPSMRVAQMVIAPVITPDLVVSETLSGTARGNGGFGSTGVTEYRQP
jgi:dUTP pyrophosphatase